MTFQNELDAVNVTSVYSADWEAVIALCIRGDVEIELTCRARNYCINTQVELSESDATLRSAWGWWEHSQWPFNETKPSSWLVDCNNNNDQINSRFTPLENCLQQKLCWNTFLFINSTTPLTKKLWKLVISIFFIIFSFFITVSSWLGQGKKRCKHYVVTFTVNLNQSKSTDYQWNLTDSNS